MSIGILSFESRLLLRVTWTVPDFLQLATESGLSVRSPDFTFADGRYCLRLFHEEEWGFCCDTIQIELLNLDDPDHERAVSYEVELKSRSEELPVYRDVDDEKLFLVYRSDLEDDRDLCVLDGTLTVLCFMRSREPGSAGSPESGGAQTQVFSQHRMTGNLSSGLFPYLYITWRIPAFFQLTQESECALDSLEFPFSGHCYRLRLVPCRRVEIHLVNLTDPVPGRYVSYEVGLKSTTGEEIEMDSYDSSTKRKFYIQLDDGTWDRDVMQRVHFPDGYLTVFCCMYSREPSSDKEVLPDISKLSLDLRKLLQKMPDSDACLVVSGKEFRAHRMMLRARSTVFDAMFGHETPERESGRVVIDDLDPYSFGDFLEYLYTGTVGKDLSDDNVFGLYKAADKYDVPTLKAKCVAFMRRNLSVDSFSDVLAVALLHSEEELLSRVVPFFKENMARIIVTAKWKQFATDNGASANELFIKAIVPPGQ